MKNTYEEKLSSLRGEMLEKIREEIFKRGTNIDGENDFLSICTYDGNEIGSDLFISGSDDYSEQVWRVTAHNGKGSICVVTDHNSYMGEELYADEICNILEHILSLTDNDLEKCVEWTNN